MRRQILIASLFALPVLLGGTVLPSPENQVFQWSHTAPSEPWPDGTAHRATAYLWIPETCERVRGLLLLATNVPEHRLVGHDALRRVCREHDLALVWSVPSFWRFGRAAPAPGLAPVDVKSLPGSDARQVRFLESLLGGLAERSGYSEIADAPWLPIGESGHLLMVAGLVNERPDRCLAAICVKNPHLPRDRTVPMLWTLGTGQEWGQSKVHLRDHWRNTGHYRAWVEECAQTNWPLSLIIEPGTGHFLCSNEMAEFFGRYIGAIARARLPHEATAPLRPLAIDAGFLAHLPLPEVDDPTVLPHAGSTLAERRRPWFPDAALAREAQRLSTADWDAAIQLVGFTGGAGVRVEPFSFNSVTRLSVATDGEFEVGATLLPTIPDGFVGAGEGLARALGPTSVEWLCGPVAPVAPGRFRVSLDRTWKAGAACYLIAQHEGDTATRRTVQPALVTLIENNVGTAQAIDFELPDTVPAGTVRLPLVARASSGLPVQFYVESGPAIVRGDTLEFTAVPPRARFPMAVTVVAWQWGRASEPRVRTAPLVRRTLHLTELFPPS